MSILPKKDMRHGWWYLGRCRNTPVAVWDGVKQEFVYLRVKFGQIFEERLPHVEDDPDGKYDVFIPEVTLRERLK